MCTAIASRSLTKWAERYERSQENILCPQRVANNEERTKGRFVKQRDTVIQEAWAQSDNGKSFARALAEQGYVLARGDRRDVVVIDPNGRTRRSATHRGREGQRHPGAAVIAYLSPLPPHQEIAAGQPRPSAT